jgi:phage gp45-like
VNDTLVKQINARVRNLFSVAVFQKRYEYGGLQVKTLSGRVLERKEAFPYGFAAKAKSGKAPVFCQGGNFNGFEILPLIAGDDVCPPELEEGDAALYAQGGGRIIARENGTVELFGTDAGGLVKAAELERQLNKLTVRVDGIIEALKNSQTVATDGGAAYKAQIAAALALLADREDFSNLESEKVLHGTGKQTGRHRKLERCPRTRADEYRH